MSVKLRTVSLAVALLAAATPVSVVGPLVASADHAHASPEPVSVSRLPLPPTAPETGLCTHPTGCIDAGREGVFGLRTFTWDTNHVFVGILYAKAPAAPDPASVYSGRQLILVKTDGTTFPNGEGWRCVTCGVPAENRVGVNLNFDYPEAFRDERRVKIGTSILDCSPHRIIDAACTPAVTHIYPIASPFPAFPAGGIMRETRLHPDDVHLGWNQLFLAGASATQFGAFGRLDFLPAPPSGPPRYELTNVSFMLSDDLAMTGRFISVKKPGELRFDKPAGVIGEFRGFTSDGRAALGIGTQDSFNYDVFTTDLRTGKSTRLTRDPAYTDPATMSPNDNWVVIQDGRVDNRTGYLDGNPPGSDGRLYFASALPGVPPLLDLAISSAVGNLYNNQFIGQDGGRRFFQPYLINVEDPIRAGDPEIHDGQQLNGGGDTTPGNGGISDPLWNGGADPAWSPDGTSVVYYQRLVAPPACEAPTPPEPTCPVSREPGGRYSRLMIAELTSRRPKAPKPQPQPVADSIPWGMPYTAGTTTLPPVRPEVPAGTYRLKGKQGSAVVEITHGPSPFNPGLTWVTGVKVTYDDYSADGVNFVNGTEEGIKTIGPTTYTWHADLTLSGLHRGTRTTSEPGGFVVASPGLAQPPTIAGTLTGTLDGLTFTSPVTGS
jgi:hypothetical protein